MQIMAVRRVIAAQGRTRARRIWRERVLTIWMGASRRRTARARVVHAIQAQARGVRGVRARIRTARGTARWIGTR